MRQIFQYLVYRKDCRGRAIIQSIPELGLKKWDRLLPSKTLPNVANFEVTEPPFQVTFWRMKKDMGAPDLYTTPGPGSPLKGIPCLDPL